MSHLILVLLILLASTTPALAIWPNDPSVNLPLTGGLVQSRIRVRSTTDMAGGAIVIWMDARNELVYEIYAQRVDGDGQLLWQANGINAAPNPAGNDNDPEVASDGAGGAVVCWTDFRVSPPKIYAQRISPEGFLLWPSSGVPLATAAGAQYKSKIVSDGQGGAIVAWQDSRVSDFDLNIYAQRIDAGGNLLWGTAGVPVVAAVGEQLADFRILPDGAGGALFFWTDLRTLTRYQIYGQHLAAGGTQNWATDGVLISPQSSGDSHIQPCVIADGSGGAIVAWTRNTSTFDIVAQRVDGAGARLWAANGIPVCAAPWGQTVPQMIAGADSSALIAWVDSRTGGNPLNQDIYAARLNLDGSLPWTTGGVAVCTAPNEQTAHVIATDGGGGAYIVWTDFRDGVQYDLYHQHLMADGTLDLAVGGAAVNLAPSASPGFVTATATGDGHVILAWDEFRSPEKNIFADRIGGPVVSGVGPHLPSPVQLAQNRPNPFNPSTVIEFTLAAGGQVRLEIFDVRGRKVGVLLDEQRAAGTHSVRLDASQLASGVYMYRLNVEGVTQSKRMALVR